MITIGIPYRDRLPELVVAIRSVFAQSYTGWQLILMDDGSDDSVNEHLAKISDDRVRMVVDGRRLGIAARLNRIAAMADTPFLARMDSDDAMLPWRLESQIRALTDSGLDLVGTRAFALSSDGEVEGLYAEAPLPARRSGYLQSNAFTHPTVAGRSDWFRENPYEEGLIRIEDKELWLRTHASSHFAKLSEPLLFYRIPHRVATATRRAEYVADRGLIRRYGRSQGLHPDYRVLMARSALSQSLFEASRLSPRLAKRLYSRRLELIPVEALEQAQATYDSVLRQAVPGW